MSDSPVWQHDAVRLAELIRDRVLSSRGVVQAHLDRIAEVNPAVNAITAVLAESALAAADRVDAALAAGRPVGPLGGVPFTVKDNIDVAGEPTTDGSPLFRDRRAPGDAPAVAHLRAAGAIPLARTNMPDFGMRWHTDNDLHGPTINPWDRTRTPYGSSGGEAVALATGASPLGLGNDYGGSIRLPAAAAGVVGLRPTQGRVASASGTIPVPPPISLQLFAVDGPMARRVGDVAAAYEALCAPDARDPQWVPAPPRLPLPDRITVTVVADPGGMGVDPAVAAAVRRAADALADAGVDIVERQPPELMAAAELWRTLSTADVEGLLDGVMRKHASAGGLTYLEQSITHVPRLDLAGFLDALGRRHAIASAWSQFTAETHAILGPVSTRLTPRLPFDLAGPANADQLWLAHRLLVAVNLLGLPALSVPAGPTPDGQPCGVQIVAGRYHEALCLHLGAIVERAGGSPTPIEPAR
ncbi:amidase [Actinoplanes subtropicus]|uniref:amidase n=1 Tax=Actinoplanes subtropicus TaxID=543632 RepID=UPI0004C407C8|nr:amidase [Actinoplanes subtropicus]